MFTDCACLLTVQVISSCQKRKWRTSPADFLLRPSLRSTFSCFVLLVCVMDSKLVCIMASLLLITALVLNSSNLSAQIRSLQHENNNLNLQLLLADDRLRSLQHQYDTCCTNSN